MIEGQFNIIFRGQTVKSFSLEQVKANLVHLFKSSPEAVEPLFSGNEMVIKKSLDYATAMKYQSALKKAGALALIKEIESSKPATQTTQTTEKTQGRAAFGVETEETSVASLGNNTSNTEPTQAAVNQTMEQAAEKQAAAKQTTEKPTEGQIEGAMVLAPAGSRILPNKVYEKREVDTSEYSLAGAGERLLAEKAPENHPQPSIEHLKLED